MLDIAKDSTLDPARITCPLLRLVAEKEYANSAVSRRFQDDAIKANRNPKSRLIVVRACDGGDAHTTGPNLSTEGFLPGPAVAAVGRSRGRSPIRHARRRAGAVGCHDADRHQPGAVREVVDPCLRDGIGICQMPCPEQLAWDGVLKRHLLRL